MSRIAIATLQTPWDCKWSRFGRMRTTRPGIAVEGLWVCVYGNAGRRPIEESVCATCPNWEYEPSAGRMAVPGANTDVSAESTCAVAACPHINRAEKRLEIGTRVSAFALAVLLAGMGFVVLTLPFAIPLTISLWMGAVASFFLGVWGRFNRRDMREESW
jgi:hypothetical protein